MARAARAAGITSVARPWMNDPGLITRYLDCGVGGIKVPHVEDAKTARAILDVVRYARPQDHADKIVVIMRPSLSNSQFSLPYERNQWPESSRHS